MSKFEQVRHIQIIIKPEKPILISKGTKNNLINKYLLLLHNNNNNNTNSLHYSLFTVPDKIPRYR